MKPAVPDLHAAAAFGLVWHSDFPLDHFAALPTPAGSASANAADVTLHHVAALSSRPGGKAINRGTVYHDGFRFGWNDVAVFDVFDGTRIDVLPLHGWTGELPWPFYSTVTALLLAWRGKLPVHACTVALGNRAIMLCGPSGAGKSTLCAGLVASGATLLSDDLTVIAPGGAGMPALALPGRPGIRLFADIAAAIPGSRTQPLDDDPRGKVMAVWPECPGSAPVPISTVVILQDRPAPASPAARIAMISGHTFRPKWIGELDGKQERFDTVAALVGTAQCCAANPLGPFSAASLTTRVEELIALHNR